MTRIITFFALLGLFLSASAISQTRTLATLSHNGELTFFDQISALEDALKVAKDGDIIYLSSGKFGASSSAIELKKRVSIVGNGYDSHIVKNIYLMFSNDTVNYIRPAFEGVKLEKLYGDSHVGELELRASYIKEIELSSVQQMLIDRCNIDLYTHIYGINIHILNSKIRRFKASPNALVENCNIDEIPSGYYPSYIVSTIINKVYLDYPTVVYENCVIGKNTYTSGVSRGELRNCYNMSGDVVETVLDDDLECTIDLIEKGYLGVDGTQVGVYGGEWFPFTTTPTVPTVDAAASSVTYDSENNQIKVNITVAE